MNVFNKLPDQLQKALEQEGFSEPTPIQKEAIPKVIAGSDLMGIAQTGTGKTAAFVLPILHRMLVEPKKGIRALILCPTRELAIQVSESIKTLAKHTKIKHTAVYGGVTQNPQVRSLKNGVDILVATPGRLFDLYDQGHIKLNTVDFFVLDEADRMLDMGFIHDINKISTLLPKTKQTLFFSATMSKTVSYLAQSLLTKPVRVEVTPEATPVEKIEQKVFFVDHENKIDLLLHLLEADHLDKVIIFVRTKRGADSLARVLKNNRISVQQIHGDRTQSQRTKTLDAFKGKLRCLIATDVAARGIDVENISHVINYDLPTDAENYVHRIGRTARAGKEGVAYSFCTRDDMPLLRAVQKSINSQIEFENHKFHSDSAKNSKIKIVPKRPRPRGGKPPGRSGGRGGSGKPRSSSFSKDKAPRARFGKGSLPKGRDDKPFKKGGKSRDAPFKKNDRGTESKPFKKGGFGKRKTPMKSSKNFAGSKGKRYEKAKNRRKDRFK